MSSDIKELSTRLSKLINKPESKLILLSIKFTYMVEWFIDYLEKNDPDCPSTMCTLGGDPIHGTRIEDLKSELEEMKKLVGCDPTREFGISDELKKELTQLIIGESTIQ